MTSRTGEIQTIYDMVNANGGEIKVESPPAGRAGKEVESLPAAQAGSEFVIFSKT